MKTLFKIIANASNNKKPKFHLEGNSSTDKPNPIDKYRNKLRSTNLIKYLIKKSLFEKGQKFGQLTLKNIQQVNAIMRFMKQTIIDHVNENFVELDYMQLLKKQNFQTAKRLNQFYDIHELENESFATIKPMTTDLHTELKSLVIDQLSLYFKNTLKGKIVKG